MTKAVLICPGRGTYNKSELGTLNRNFPDLELLAHFDTRRSSLGQETLSELDRAEKFSPARHTRGDNASALIYAASFGDFLALRPDIELVAVTGNSMGWYSALACAGAVSAENGFEIVNTMGRLMQDTLIGGQMIYPHLADDWRSDPEKKARLLEQVDEIDARPDQSLSLSIDLGGMLVLAGDNAGLASMEAALPKQDRFPMRLPNHAAFHSPLMAPISRLGKQSLDASLFKQPSLPMIDGRGAIWWPQATDTKALWEYTLGHQVTQTYDFTHAITIAAREFAPDIFIVAGPGTTLGGAVAQSLVLDNWRNMQSKTDFQSIQSQTPLLVSMARDDQRGAVT